MFTEWLKLNEHIWLFWQLNIEIILGIGTFIYVCREFHYDAAKDEAKSKKRKPSNHKVKVVIDADGNARIEEAPKDLNISIEHEGKQ